jgi:hypothetical protein
MSTVPENVAVENPYQVPLLIRFFEWLYRGSVTSPDFRPRDRPMEILALGVSRSGTDSLKRALEELGYDHTYHGWDPMVHPEQCVFWYQALNAKFRGGKKFTREDWDRMFGNCRAISDLPAILFAEELMEAYPEAKVILSTRDADSWYQSVTATFEPMVTNWPIRFAHFFHPVTFQYEIIITIYHYFFRGSFERNGKTIYANHNNMVRRLVPKERLLEYHVREGWKPLCDWLGKDTPKREIPNVNSGEEFRGHILKLRDKWRRKILWNMLKVFGSTTCLAVGCYQYL